jgi:hypothetical protein
MPKKRKSLEHPKFRLERRAGEISARWRTGTSPIGCFMLFWMTGWSTGCVFLGYLAWTERSAQAIGGAAVFWCGWLIGLIVLLRQWFGRESITLSADGVRTTSGALLRTTQTAALAEVVGFTSATDDRSGDGPQKRLNVHTVGRPLRVGEGLSGDEISTLAAEMRGVLKELRGSRNLKSGYPKEAALVVFRDRLPGELPATPRKESPVEVRNSGDSPIELPSDSRLQRRDGFDDVTIWRRGRLYGSALFALLVIVGFWNGVVGMFVYELWLAPPGERPVGIDWIWKFVFLIPFEVLGALFMFGVLLIALEPMRVWTRRFARDEIVDRLAWFGFIRFQKRHPVSSVDRLEVRRVPYEVVKFPKRLPLASLWAPPGCATYDVVPVDPVGKDVCRIEGLTFGEACWLADTLLRTCGDWFRQ